MSAGPCGSARMWRDIGPGEQLVGIEVLDASRGLGGGHVPELVIENLPKSAKPAAGMLVVREEPAPYG